MVDGIVHVPSSFASKQKKSTTATNLRNVQEFKVKKREGIAMKVGSKL